jgi:sensor histidine kinase regulating citrate/malate metabolism
LSSSSIKKEVEEYEEAKRKILDEDPHIPKDPLEFMLSLPSRTKDTQSHGTGNYTCNSRAARRNGKTTIEEK